MHFITLLYLAAVLKHVKTNSEYFSLPDDYDKKKRPGDGSRKPLEVKICFVIVDIQDVDEFDTKLEMSVLVVRWWKEKRLNVTSSIQKDKHYVVRAEDVDAFWTPDFYIDGSRRSRKGFSEVFTNIVIQEDKTLIHLMRLDVAVRCNFDFYLYPLDVQYCQIDMGSIMNSGEVHLSWTNAFESPVYFHSAAPMSEILDLPEYIVHYHVCPDSFTHRVFLDYTRATFVRFYLVLKRRIKSHLMETYIPTGLFVIMSWGSFIVKADAIPGRMVLLVTNLLSIVTLFESARDSSPGAIGVKCVDVWVLACIVFVFLALMEYAIILAKARGKCINLQSNKVKNSAASIEQEVKYYKSPPPQSKCSRRMRQKLKFVCHSFCCRNFDTAWDPLDKVSLFIFPLAFLGFNIVYWSIYLHMREESMYAEECK